MSSTIDTNNQRRNGRRFSLFSSQKVGVVDENETRRPNEKPSPPKQNPQRRRSLVEALNDLASKLDLDDEVVDSSDDEADVDARLKVVSRQKSFPNEQRRRSSLPLSLGRVGPALGEPLDPKSGHSSFRRPCFQRGEVRENANSPVRPTFVPKNLRNKLRFEQSEQRTHFPKSWRSVVFPWFFKNLTRNMRSLGTKHHAKKRRRRTKFCSQQRPIRGRIRNKNTTINHIIILIHVLGACLCNAGRIGLL